MEFKVKGLSRCGGRELNQDACVVRIGTDATLVAVADGLGSYTGSEFASDVAVKMLADEFGYRVARGAQFDEAMITGCFEAAHEAVKRIKTALGNCNSACTTLCALFAVGDRLAIAHIGDSRIYQIRRGEIVAQTVDDSMAQNAVDAGLMLADEIRFSEEQNQLTRALGSGRFKGVHVAFPQAATGDRFVLCSDGFWEYVYEEDVALPLYPAEYALGEWEKLIATSPAKTTTITPLRLSTF